MWHIKNNIKRRRFARMTRISIELEFVVSLPLAASLPSLTKFPRSSWWILISLYPTLYFIVTGNFTQPVPLYPPLQPCMITIDWTSDEWTTTTKRPRHRLTFKLHAHSHRARPTDSDEKNSIIGSRHELWGISSSLRQRRGHNIHFIRLCYGSCVRWPQSRKRTSIPCWKLMIHWLTLWAFSDRLLFWLVIDVKAIFHNGKSSEGPFTKWINNTTSWAAAHKK